MTKKIQLLSILAVVQLVLIVVIWLKNDPLQGHSQQSTLLTFNQDAIDRIIISDQEGSVQLTKSDNQWQTLENFPADETQVNALLAKLSTLKFGLPVATSGNALQRFKVSDDNFERQIKLQKDDEIVAQLYLGSGAGARRSHARNANQDSVYSIAMAGYDAPSKPHNWYDKTVLEFSKDDVSAIKFGETEFVIHEDKENTNWKLSSEQANKEFSQDSLDAGLTELAGLRFNNLLGAEQESGYDMENPKLALSLSFKDSSTRNYHLFKKQDSEEYILKTSNRKEYFEIASYTANALIEKLSTNLWIEKKENENTPSSAKSESKNSNPENMEISQQN